MSEPMWGGQRRLWCGVNIELKKAVSRIIDNMPTRGWAFIVDGQSEVGWMSVENLRRYTVLAPSERADGLPPSPAAEPRRHSHYFRSVAGLQEIDVYRVLELFGVTDQALGHAIKKLVVPGMRGGGKPVRKDIEEAVDTLRRRLEMMDEDDRRV